MILSPRKDYEDVSTREHQENPRCRGWTWKKSDQGDGNWLPFVLDYTLLMALAIGSTEEG